MRLERFVPDSSCVAASALNQNLLVQLEQPPFEVLSDGSLRRTLSFMRQWSDTRLTSDIARGLRSHWERRRLEWFARFSGE